MIKEMGHDDPGGGIGAPISWSQVWSWSPLTLTLAIPTTRDIAAGPIDPSNAPDLIHYICGLEFFNIRKSRLRWAAHAGTIGCVWAL